MREKLIELVGQVQDCGCDVTDVVAMNYVENITLVDHLISNGVTVQEWISVKDRLPEKKGTFLVCTKNDFYCTKNIAKVRFYDGEWHGTGGIWSNVTHWMPLPEPPKGE
jgi:hypothetical protein